MLIVVLALVIIGPERLPGAARKAGYWIGRGRRFIEGVRSEVESEFDLGEFKRLLHNQEVQINELQRQLKSEVSDIHNIKAGLKDDIVGSSIEQDLDVQDFDTDKISVTTEDNSKAEVEQSLLASNDVVKKTETTDAGASADIHKDKPSI